jgi:hypothetical protein
MRLVAATSGIELLLPGFEVESSTLLVARVISLSRASLPTEMDIVDVLVWYDRTLHPGRLCPSPEPDGKNEGMFGDLRAYLSESRRGGNLRWCCLASAAFAGWSRFGNASPVCSHLDRPSAVSLSQCG